MDWAIVNRRAGGYSEARLGPLRERFGRDRLCVTGDLDELDQALSRALAVGAEAIWACGGDGTFVAVVNRLARLTDAGPPVGMLPWGTGNAVSDWLGASSSNLAPRQVRMIDAGGALTPVVGLGLHAAMSRDVHRWRRWLPARWLWSLAPPWTLLRYAFRRVRLRVVTLGPALPIDVDGEPIGPELSPGAVLHDGEALLLDAGTCPVIGFGHRIFPHAERRSDRFHLRVLTMSSLDWLRTWPEARRGRLNHPRARSWLAEDVTVEGLTPLSRAGDDDGLVVHLRLRLADPSWVMAAP